MDVITLVKVALDAEEIKQNWLLRARHRDEASKLGLVSTNLADVVAKLFTRTLWHPSARMRLIQFLFNMYGIDEVAKAIKEKRERHWKYSQQNTLSYSLGYFSSMR